MSIQHSLSNAFDSFTRKINSYRQTPLERQVSDATSNENWGVANSTLIELARATADYNNYAVIMKGIWEGVSDKKEKWRRIYKSLVLLEYCVKHGAERCADEAKGESYRLRPLHDFKFMEEGRDKGAGIREKSKQLTDLLADPEALRTERNKAREGKEKYAGVSSNAAGGQTMVTPSGYSGSYGGSRSGTAISSASVSNPNAGNSTSKLDEYREKERQRLEAKKAEENRIKNQGPQIKPPTYTDTGKLVVKAPVLKGSGRKDDSSSSDDSSSEDEVGGGNLIDFDAPVKPVSAPAPAPVSTAPPKPAVCNPGYPAWKPVDPVPQAVAQQRQATQPVAQTSYQQPVAPLGYQQQQPAYTQPVAPAGYQQPSQQNPGYAAFNMMQPVPQQSYNPYAQQMAYPTYGYQQQPMVQAGAYSMGAQPMVHPTGSMGQPSGYNNPYAQPAATKEQPKASTNPFDAFNGL